MQNVLKNIAQQSYLPSEIIIVDNNSELKEQKNNEKLAKKYNAEYFLMNKNLGVSGGRNYGLKRANGDIIIEIDDDAEFVSRTSIEKVVKYFQKID
jgi:glycosyltransferase involved in cell wall biosynthesis